MKRNTKSALLLSVVSIVVCCAMLMGTTMAWFTDSVTSAKNVIVAGNLDVELYHTNPTETDELVDGTTDLFFTDIDGEEILWEPGVVAYEKFTVKNEGNLALKYKLLMHVYDATANADGNTLEDVIKVAIADTVPATRADVANLSFDTLSNFEVKSEKWLEPDDNDATTAEKSSEDFIVVLYWEPSDNDNDYNMNNGENTVLDITFGVNLLATQKDHEEDSFGNDYDVIDDLDMITENINGVTYGTTITGDYVMVSVDDYTLTNFTVDDAVTILGTGNGVDDNDRVFGKNAPLTSLTLPEGLVEIKDNALNTLPNLTTVNLPSTLKTIGIQAFRITGMSELKVPESVETVKMGAFRDMANLTTVTVEGNVAFDEYAFRSCPNLTSIYLLGDDVTFTGSQFATHYDTGDATGITIYVKNATVAARVYAAQTSAYGYEVKILGAAADGSDASDVEKVANNTQFSDAIANGASTVVLGNGDYIIPAAAQGKTLTVVGNGSTSVAVTKVGTGGENCDYGLDGSNVTFENVTITTNSSTYIGYARCNGTYNNCTINGTYTLYGNSVFNNCTFNVTGDVYNIWTWGAPTATFNNCTFNSDGKALLLYGTENTKLTVNGCTFNDNGGLADLKAAIEIGNDYGKSYELIVNNTTVNGYEINDKGINTGSTLWANKNSMGTDKLNVVIDGVDVY